MKKTILVKSALALAIAAATSAPTFAQMTDGAPEITGVSGRFAASIICTSDACEQKDAGGRFRMNASEDLGNGNEVFGRFEFAVDTSDGTLKAGGKAQRLAYVGIRGDFGDFSMGSRWSTFYNTVSGPVDWAKAFGGTYRAGIEKGGFRQHDSFFYSIGGFSAMVTVKDDVIAPPTRKDANGDLLRGDANTLAMEDDIKAIKKATGYKAEAIDLFEVGYSGSFGAVNYGVAGRFPADTPGVDADGKATKTNVENTYGLNLNGDAGTVRLSATFYKQDDNSSVLAQAVAPVGSGKFTFSLGKDKPKAAAAGEAPVPQKSMVALEYSQNLSTNSSWFVGIEKVDPDTLAKDATTYGVGLQYNFN